MNFGYVTENGVNSNYFAPDLVRINKDGLQMDRKILETGKLLLFTQKGVDFREKCGKASESYQTERNLGEFCRGMFQGLSSLLFTPFSVT